MSDGNGHAADGMALPRPTVLFRVGGEDVPVPSMRFRDMDELKTELAALTPEAHWVDYAGNVLRVIAHQLASVRPDLSFEVLRERCTGGEATQLATQMNELLWASGFPRPPETPAENPGTGTLTGSVPVSPPGESAEAIPSS